MQEARSRANEVAGAICDAFNEIGDFSYAIMPRDVAHAVGDLNKAILSTIRGVVDWEIKWIDERMAGGDKLRDEWREKCRPKSAGTDTAAQPGV